MGRRGTLKDTIAHAGVLLLTALVFPLFFALSSIVWLLTLLLDRRLRLYHYSLSAWCYVYILLNPLWRFQVTGRDNLPKEACILVANHQSFMDILVLFALFLPFKWVAKRELFHAPMVGAILRMGRHVAIKRGDVADAKRMKERCLDLLQSGEKVMIFPEGTRRRDGSLGRFHTGAAQIALQAGVPLVPIVMSGALDAFKGSRATANRVLYSVQILNPHTPPASPEEVGPITEALHEAMEQALQARERSH